MSEQELQAFGEFLNSKGYALDLDKDMLWAEEWDFQDHKTREVFELCEEFFSKRHEERIKERAIEFAFFCRKYMIPDRFAMEKWYNEKYESKKVIIKTIER